MVGQQLRGAKNVPKAHTELAACRKEWGKTYNAGLAKRTRGRAWSRTVNRSVYTSMGQLMARLGFSDPDAVPGAATLAGKGPLMGGAWTKIHPQTKIHPRTGGALCVWLAGWVGGSGS